MRGLLPGLSQVYQAACAIYSVMVCKNIAVMLSADGISYEYRAATHEVSHGYLLPIVTQMLADVPLGATVLDLGCGNGSFLSLLQGRGWKLVGTDLSPTGIEIAKQSYPKIEFFLSDVQSGDLQCRAGDADVILSTEVIEHLYDPKGFLRNAYRLLRPGGILVVSTPYHGYLKNLSLAAIGAMDRHYTVLWDHGHIKFWSKTTLTAALEDCGFRFDRFKGAGRIPYLWKSMVIKATKAAA